MATKPTAGAHIRDLRVPPEIADALDRSADDLRHNRTEDVDQYLKRLQKRLDAYRAKRKRSIDTSGR
jgi:hypothetical protein